MDDEMGWEAQQDNEEHLAHVCANNPHYLETLKTQEKTDLDKRIAKMTRDLEFMKTDDYFRRIFK